ncbi:hypothetical protein LMG24235_00288 [Paraburkholderia sabiae]|nr:hypothetical protein LMG24235_00288 [Paraburkholderia sabiae]
MRLVRFLINSALTLAITCFLAWGFGHVPFSDHATNALIRMGAWFGIYGDEALEDFYFYVTLSLSFVAAVVAVLQGKRLLGKRNWRRSDVK